jgi:hypothetical protein
MPRLKAAAPQTDDDDDDGGQPRRVHHPAGSWPARTSPVGSSSVFAAGAAALPVKSPRSSPARIDPTSVVIRKGMPLPPIVTNAASGYVELLQKMVVGDCVEITAEQSRTAVARAKTIGIKVAVRRQGALFGLWRLA